MRNWTITLYAYVRVFTLTILTYITPYCLIMGFLPKKHVFLIEIGKHTLLWRQRTILMLRIAIHLTSETSKNIKVTPAHLFDGVMQMAGYGYTA